MSTAPIPTGPAKTGPNGLRIAVIAIGALLLVAVVVIAYLVGRGTGNDGVNAGAQTPTPTTSDSAVAMGRQATYDGPPPVGVHRNANPGSSASVRATLRGSGARATTRA